MNFAQKLAAFERQLIEEELGNHDWNICRTALAIGIHRNTLRLRIKLVNVRFPEKYRRRNAKLADAQRRAMSHRVGVYVAPPQTIR